MGWHERHGSVYDRISRGLLRPEALNLKAWIFHAQGLKIPHNIKETTYIPSSHR